MNVVEMVRSIGWLHQTGGSGPYLSLAARMPGLGRAEVDASVASGALRIVTGVRGCTLLVPASDVGLARAAGARAFTGTLQSLLHSGEIDAQTLDGVVNNVDAMLDFEGVDPATLRSRAGGIPALGPTGRQLGFSTALPVALRILESIDRSERVPANGRLDSEAYLWRHPRDVDRGDGPPPGESVPADLFALARAFFRWDGGAERTLADLAGWLDCPERALQGLVARGRPHAPFPNGPAYLPLGDPWLSLRSRNGDRVAPEHRAARVMGSGNETCPVGEVESLHHHAIVAGGRIVGIWEWSRESGMVSGFFGEPPQGWEAAAGATRAFIEDQLGDVYVHGRDGARPRAARMAAVQGCAVQRVL